MASKKPHSKSAEQQKVYRRRRITVAIVLVVAVVFVWALVKSFMAVGSEVSQYIHRDELTSVSKKAVPSTVPMEGIGDCTSGQVELQLTAAAEKVTSGESLRFSASLGHVGKTSCLVDGSAASRVLTITSGDQEVWSSALCPADPRQLLMASQQKDIQDLMWNTTASMTECNATAEKPAAPGMYKAKLTLKDVPGAESNEVAFEVTAAPEPEKSDDADGDAATDNADAAEGADSAATPAEGQQ